MKRIAFFLTSGALMLSAAGKGTFTGVITDTMCGAGHQMMNVKPDAKCVLECTKHNKSVKLALLDGKNVYVLSDQQTPAKFAGQKVKITGTLYEKTKILQVDSIEPAAGGMEMPMEHSGHMGH